MIYKGVTRLVLAILHVISATLGRGDWIEPCLPTFGHLEIPHKLFPTNLGQLMGIRKYSFAFVRGRASLLFLC